MFEGEYLNGKKWNGKGYLSNNAIDYEIKNGNGHIKEYDDGSFIFEGEYLNGQRNGKGKEIESGNNVKFIGEYLNGLRNGYGKEIYPLFIGEYLNGKRNGKGKEYKENICLDIKLKEKNIILMMGN